MRRILFSALLAILASAPLLHAQDPTTALASLADLSRRGQIPQVIQAADALLANDKLAPTDQAMTLVYLGYAYQQSGEFTKATANYEKALAVVGLDGEHSSEYAATLATLASVYAEIGQIDTAKHVLLRSVHLFEEQSNHAGAAMIWSNLATIAAGQRDRREAHKCMAHSVDEQHLARDISQGELAELATTEGRIAELDRDPRAAIQDYEHALELWQQTEKAQQQRIAWLHVLLSNAYLQAGDLANAHESITRGMTQLEATSGRQTVQYFGAELVYSKVLEASGSHEEASALRKDAQAGLNTGTDRQRAKGEISVSALR